jgi:hypothetical protein
VTTASLTLEGPTLERSLPFRVIFNDSGQLLEISPALRRYWALGETPLADIEVWLRRPFSARLDRRHFGNLTDMSLDLVAGATGHCLHAELLEMPSGQWLLVGMPDLHG